KEILMRVSTYGVVMSVLCQNEILVRLHEPLHPYVLKHVGAPFFLDAFLLMLFLVLLARYVYSVEFENRKNRSHHKRWYILLVSRSEERRVGKECSCRARLDVYNK